MGVLPPPLYVMYRTLAVGASDIAVGLLGLLVGSTILLFRVYKQTYHWLVID